MKTKLLLISEETILERIKNAKSLIKDSDDVDLISIVNARLGIYMELLADDSSLAKPLVMPDERFKRPTDKQTIDFAIIFNDGKLDEQQLTNMVGMADMMIDRLYENGDVSMPTVREIMEGDEEDKFLGDAGS